jgi:nitrous oxidase accessory protein NosD
VTALTDALADVLLLPGDAIKIWGTCTGNFIVTKSLTLVGQTPNVTLDGNNSGSVLSVIGAITAEIDNLTITHGLSGLGGGIYAPFVFNNGIFSFANLTLNNSTVTQNNATGEGGGIGSEGA